MIAIPSRSTKSSSLLKPKTVARCRRPFLNPCTLESFAFQVDPYIGCGHLCSYCYVLSQAETDWAREITLHANLTDRLREAIRNLEPQCIYLGWHTDPYQPCEEDLRQTREVLELLLEMGFSASILTKSDLVLRDLDVLRKMDQASVSVSVAFDDDTVRRRFEANTVATDTRIDALREAKAAGVRTTAMLCPVIPHVTRVPLLIDRLAPHVDKIWVYGLSIPHRGDRNWQDVRRILATHYPDLLDHVERAVFDRGHDDWKALRADLEALAEDRDLDLSIHI